MNPLKDKQTRLQPPPAHTLPAVKRDAKGAVQAHPLPRMARLRD